MEAWIWGAIIGAVIGIITSAIGYAQVGKWSLIFIIVPFLVSQFLAGLFGGHKFIGGMSAPSSSGLSSTMGTLVTVLTLIICVALWALVGAGIGALVGLFLGKR